MAAGYKFLHPADAGQVPRLGAFRAIHPGVTVKHILAGDYWEARWRDTRGKDVTIIARPRLKDLLDKLWPGTG